MFRKTVESWMMHSVPKSNRSKTANSHAQFNTFRNNSTAKFFDNGVICELSLICCWTTSIAPLDSNNMFWKLAVFVFRNNHKYTCIYLVCPLANKKLYSFFFLTFVFASELNKFVLYVLWMFEFLSMFTEYRYVFLMRLTVFTIRIKYDRGRSLFACWNLAGLHDWTLDMKSGLSQ